jgi:hypothetical protein
MGSESKVLRLPVPREKVTCHLTVPRFDHAIGNEEDVPSGMAAIASEMERVAEQFDTLAHIFEECSEASYSPQTFFINGHLTFVFQVPRRMVQRLRELGWSAGDLDVEPEGTVPSETEFSDA